MPIRTGGRRPSAINRVHIFQGNAGRLIKPKAKKPEDDVIGQDAQLRLSTPQAKPVYGGINHHPMLKLMHNSGNDHMKYLTINTNRHKWLFGGRS